MGLTASTLTFPEGGTGYVWSFQDVTDVRRLERDARLRQRLAAVGEMAAGIAHEIRNPLASMSGSIQVLRQELPLSEDQAQLMDIVLRESERLNDTIRSFLAYARPQRSALARLDVRKVLQDTAILLRNSAEVRSDHVDRRRVPAEPGLVRSRRESDSTDRLEPRHERAARDVQGRASAADRRRRTGAEGDEWVVLAVQDEGCGIAPEDLDSIFQPFRSSFERGQALGSRSCTAS